MAQILEFRKASRKQSKLRLGLSGPSGSGKTVSSLLIAYGITDDWNKIAIIDTEQKSADLYQEYSRNGIKIGTFNVITLEPPFTPEIYIEAIQLCEDNGAEVIIIDSLTHAWTGEGGILDLQGKIVDSGKGNSYTAWRFVTPKHNALVDAMLLSKCHVIATLRAKMAYAMQEVNGKTEVKKVGLEPIQRDGMEYEFTLFLDINRDHTATASKDRTGLFDMQFFRPKEETGKILKDWLDKKGTEETQPPAEAETPSPSETPDEITPEIEEQARISSINGALDNAKTLKELDEICNAYRSEYEKLSEHGKGLIKKQKNLIKARLRTNKVA